jgi:hypothetical protein
MFNLGIIKRNKVGIDMDEILKETSAVGYLKDLIKEHVQFVDVGSTDEMMDLVVSTIGLTGENIASTLHCRDTVDDIHQICHFSPKRNNLPENQDDINYLGSFLNTGREIIYGDAVILKSNITNNGTCVPSVVDIDEIVDILYRKLTPICSMLKTDGSIHEVKFINNPFSDTLKRDISEFNSVEVPILDHNLILFYEKDSSTKLLNKKASKLIGTAKVYGDVVIVLMEAENSYGTIDKQLLENLLTLSSGDISNRDVTDSERHKDEVIDGLPVVSNRHRIMQKRLSEYKKRCANSSCSSDGDTSSNVCTGCYRVSYCSKECQAADWNTHKNGCNYGKSYLNK